MGRRKIDESTEESPRINTRLSVSQKDCYSRMGGAEWLRATLNNFSYEAMAHAARNPEDASTGSLMATLTDCLASVDAGLDENTKQINLDAASCIIQEIAKRYKL